MAAVAAMVGARCRALARIDRGEPGSLVGRRVHRRHDRCLAPPHAEKARREVFLLQRRVARHGETLGRSTGWIHKLQLQKSGVKFLAGVTYREIDDRGLHVLVADRAETLEVDTIVICAGQEPLRDLAAPLREAGTEMHLVGGADEAVELDAKRAIRQATEVALQL